MLGVWTQVVRISAWSVPDFSGSGSELKNHIRFRFQPVLMIVKFSVSVSISSFENRIFGSGFDSFGSSVLTILHFQPFFREIR